MTIDGNLSAELGNTMQLQPDYCPSHSNTTTLTLEVMSSWMGSFHPFPPTPPTVSTLPPPIHPQSPPSPSSPSSESGRYTLAASSMARLERPWLRQPWRQQQAVW